MIFIYLVIWKAPVEFDPKLTHHEEHEDHEGKTDILTFILRVLRALRGYNSIT